MKLDQWKSGTPDLLRRARDSLHNSFSSLFCRFSLTLIDTLDTLVVSTCFSSVYKSKYSLIYLLQSLFYLPVLWFLVVIPPFGHCICLFLSVCEQVLNKLDEFEDAVKKAVRDVRLDNDVVVSVFETNIRVLGYETCLRFISFVLFLYFYAHL